MGVDRYWDPRMETMRRDELRHFQGHRLQWQVRRCWDASAFYRERLTAAGVKPEDIRGIDDVVRLPILTEAELSAELVGSGPPVHLAVAPDSWWREVGPPMGIDAPAAGIWTTADLIHRVAIAARVLWSWGVRPGSVVVNRLASRPDSATVDAAGHKIGATVVGPDTVLPTRSTGDPPILEVWPTWVAEARDPMPIDAVTLPPRLRGVWGDRGGFAETWSDHALDPHGDFRAYGAPRLGPTLAAECEARVGLHWAEDHLLVEIVEPTILEVLGSGERGAVVVTHLTREGTPMLRYRTALLTALDPTPCPCGRAHARSPRADFGVIGAAETVPTPG